MIYSVKSGTGLLGIVNELNEKAARTEAQRVFGIYRDFEGELCFRKVTVELGTVPRLNIEFKERHMIRPKRLNGLAN